ncbi:MAG: Trp family transcriptional regulator [Candidatus Peribacteraceae bacterium]|nr:Trp family transcriptional regulator [Candidatus Peribacteraceae bacterium]
MAVPKKHLKDLHQLFASIRTVEEAKLLLQDILTPAELEAIAERWQLIQALASGKPQRQIAHDLKLSISKITRGSRMLQYGGGGFGHFLKKLGKMKK